MALFDVRMIRFVWALSAIVMTNVVAGTAADADGSATMGIAYDTVLKTVSSADPPLRQLDFGADFQAGMTPDASCMPSVFRRYVSSDRERIDEVCKHEATIVDCAARTVTILDMEHKHYVRTSLDVAYDDGIAAMRALSDKVGSTSTLAIERTAHGTRVIDGRATEEYAYIRTQSVASPGVTVTTRDSWTYEFLPDSLPNLSCIEPAAAWISRYGWPQQYAPELQAFFSDRFTKMAGPRDRYSEAGPRLPDWRIPLYAIGAHEQRQSNVPASIQYFEVEAGNIRVLRGNDRIFSVPADFTAMAE